jgi:hypothetical protein
MTVMQKYHAKCSVVRGLQNDAVGACRTPSSTAIASGVLLSQNGNSPRSRRYHASPCARTRALRIFARAPEGAWAFFARAPEGLLRHARTVS